MKKRSNKITCLLFDHDGTVVDTEGAYIEVEWQFTNTLMERFGKPKYEKDFFMKQAGQRYSQTLEKIAQFHQLNLSKELMLELQNEIFRLSNEKILEDIRPISGVIETLTHLKHNKRDMAIVSNADMIWLDLCLPKTGLDHFFPKDRIFSAQDSFKDNVPRCKPSPDIYQLAVETLKKPHKEYIAIEDSLAGVKAAADAGLNVIGFIGGNHFSSQEKHLFTQELKAMGANQIMDKMRDLPGIIQDIEASPNLSSL